MRFLFYSPHALADSSSGAARSVNALFSNLATLDHVVYAVTGSVVDSPNDLIARILEIPHKRSLKISEFDVFVPIRDICIQGVPQMVMTFRGNRIQDVSAVEDSLLLQLFLETFDQFRPDVLVSYGGFASNYVAGQHAMGRGCKSVLYGAAPYYERSEQFLYSDHVVAVSRALRGRLERVTSHPIAVIPPLIERPRVTAKKHTAEFITFINPVPSKGLKLVAALAVESLRRQRPYKFLFVEGRGTKESAIACCPELDRLPNIAVAANTQDMRGIYERTSILLYPSLWFEAAGQICMEANANGIPVLANDVGGIPEMLDGAGFLFDPPRASLENWEAPVPAEYVEQWLAVIDRLHDDPAELEVARSRAKDADARYDPQALAQSFVDFVAT